jgi:transcriptional regulator
MYLPSVFEETRPEVLRQLILAHPLGALVTTSESGLKADHIPFALAPDSEPLKALRGHVSRANPLVAARPDSHPGESLVIFQGPETYVSPSWYPSKQVGGKVVPTWNYAVVHVYGRLRFVYDSNWLLDLVNSLTTRHEHKRAEPWHVSDAPSGFVAQQLAGIVGLELEVTRVLGKWKMSQNRSAADRAGVLRGLREEAQGAAHTVAHWIGRSNRETPEDC